MFARMEDIKAGKIDEEGLGINNVENALDDVDVKLRDSQESFRDFSTVLEEVAGKWDTLSETQQANISKAIAGVRQANIFKTLMEQMTHAQELQRIQLESSGLATQRYGIYLESVEAKSKKAQAALEGLWQETINSKTIGQFYDAVTAAIKFVDVLGGAERVITLLIGAVALLNVQLIVNKGLMAVATMQQWVATLAVAKTQTDSLAAANLKANLSMGLWVIAITAAVIAIQAYNEQIVKTNAIGVSDNVERWAQVFKDIKTDSGSATETLKAFEDEVKRINKAVADAGPIVGFFVDKQALLDNGLSQTVEKLKKTSGSYEEYSASVKKAAQEAGYSFDEFGRAFRMTDGDILMGIPSIKEYNDNIKILTPLELQAANAADILNTEIRKSGYGFEEAGNHLLEYTGKYKGLADTLKEFETTAKLTGSMLAKSLTGEEFNFDDVQKLTEANKDYLQFIEVIDGQVKINTEGLRGYDIQKAKDAIASALQDLASTHSIKSSVKELELMDAKALALQGLSASEIKQIELLRAYKDSLVDGSAYAAEMAKAQEQLNKEREKAARDALEEEKNSAHIRLQFLMDQKKAADDLLKMTIAMIRQEKEEEKDHLREQLDHYSKLIDARKDALDSLKREEDYKRGLKKDVKKATDIKNQIAILSLDNSPEAKAKILRLQQELAEQTEKIQDKQREHKLELEKKALDKEKEQFKEAIEKKMKIIEDYLKQSGTIAQDALDLIENHGEELYKKLMDWNRVYGDGIDQTVVDAWNKGREAVINYQQLIIDIDNQNILIKQLDSIDLNVTQPWKTATDALQKYIDKTKEVPAVVPGPVGGAGGKIDNPDPIGSGAGSIDAIGGGTGNGSGNGNLLPPDPTVHHSGLDSGPIGGLKMASNEQLAKLLKGEIVVNDGQANNFLRNILPNIAKASSNFNNGSNITIDTLLNVQGNIDRNVLPDVEKMLDKAIEKLNKGNYQRGILRPTNLTGI